MTNEEIDKQLKEIIGFNDRGMVQLIDGPTRYSEPVATCFNCGQSVKGKKAKDWMFGHIDCPKPDGEYIKNDVTPEKLRSIIHSIVQQTREDDARIAEKNIAQAKKEVAESLRMKEIDRAKSIIKSFRRKHFDSVAHAHQQGIIEGRNQIIQELNTKIDSIINQKSDHT